MKASASFIRSEGGLLPADLLARIRARDRELPGIKPVEYGLVPGETLNEAASRSWARLTGLWRRFAQKLATRPADQGFEADTLDLWLRPLFQELGFPQPLERARAETLGRDTFAISHRSGDLPIHLVGAGILLDKRTRGVRGAADVNPHGLLQDYLNRKDAFTWGLLSNGLRLRLLRDNAALTRQAFVEFDLEAIFSAEDQSGYADFFLLWLVCHRTRFAPVAGTAAESATPAAWIIESLRAEALKTGQRANNRLRENVVQALNHLGPGFVSHRANSALSEALRSGTLASNDFKRQLLRLIYRFVFLFVAEDRGALFAPAATPAARERFASSYSTARLRRLARRYGGTAHGDGWEQLKTLFRLLHSDSGCPALGLPALGGFLFSTASCPDLDRAHLANEHLYSALRALGLTVDDKDNITHILNYEHLGAEELGSVYESLLELSFEEGSLAAGRPRLIEAPGNERKLTGSYYTPTELITSLLDTALQPVIDRALSSIAPREALLSLKVVDPACGSGHFLVAAAHRLARALAALDTGEREPPLDAVRSALHEVIGRCLYGVDLNPLSVELCKVSLWLEALEPGRPLNFLESHIQCGNSLIGCTPRLLREGLPDETFKPIAGDDEAACAQLKKDNREARDAGQDLLGLANPTPAPWERLGNLPAAFAAVETLDDNSITSIRQKEATWQQAVVSSGYLHATLLHDAWCAAFVLPKRNDEFTIRLHTGQLRELERTPFALHADLRRAIDKLGGNAPDLPDPDRERSFRFFHWHLRFPGVFRLPAANETPDNPETGWSGGFDVVLGNPPWEHTELKEKEFFATRAPAISTAQTGAERKQLITALAHDDPALFTEFLATSRAHEGVSHFLSNSGAYPLCGRGRINTYSIFSELNLELVAPSGRAGFIVPTGIGTDDSNKFYFQKLVEEQRLAVFYDFENRKGLFPEVDSRVKFSLLTLTGRADPQAATKFFFFAHGTDELADPERQINLTPEDILRINPNTRTCPIFRTRRDAEITRRIYSKVPVLLREANEEGEGGLNPWGVRFRQGLFNMTAASHLFFTRPKAEAEGWEFVGNRWRKGDDTLLPLYEAKLFHQFDHRWATYLESASTLNPITGDEGNDGPETRDLASGEKTDPALTIQPRYWVDERWCLLIAADLPGEVTDAVRRALEESLGLAKAGKRTAAMSIADQLRRDLGRWLSGHRRPDGSFAIADAELRDLIALDQKKRPTAKKWKEELEAARAIVVDFPLTAEEADSLGQLLTASLPEQLRRIWPLFHARTPRWFLAFRDITNATNERTAIFAPIPWSGVGHTAPLVLFKPAFRSHAFCFAAFMCSMAQDYCARQKVSGTHLTYNFLQQFPVLPPETYTQPAPWAPGLTLADWLRPYVLELCYTAHDLRGFAEDCGPTGAPFRWNDTRRALLRAELDAAFFHLYGLNRDDTAYVLGTFTVLKNREQRDLGRYETADRILAAHDALSAAIATGQPFTTKLVPPPADPSLTHAHSTTRPAMPARLVRATISNYRSLSGPWNDSTRQKADPLTPVIVPLGRMTLLVGQNSAGKSSFCDALAFITDIMRRGLPAAIDNGDNRKGIASLRRQGGDTLCIRLDAEAEGINGFYELELTATTDSYKVVGESAKWKASFAIKEGKWHGDPLPGASEPPGPADLLMPLLRNDPRFRELGELLSGMVVYSVPPTHLRQPRPAATARPMDGAGQDWPSALEAVLKGPQGASLIVALNRLTGDIVDARVESAAKQRVVQFLHRPPDAESGGRWANADQESDGTLRAAALFTALLQDPLPAVVAIEEPELAIHPGALEILYDFLQSAHKSTQVIVTTHSPDLLDKFEPELIRVVIRDGSATHISAMEADQYHTIKQGLTTLGAMLRQETLRLGEVNVPSPLENAPQTTGV